MVSILLTEFLKNIFGLLERRSVDVEKTDEKLITFCLDFVKKLLKSFKPFLNKVNIDKDFLDLILRDFLLINREATNLIGHYEMEVNKFPKFGTDKRNVTVTPKSVTKSHSASGYEKSDKLRTKLDIPMTSSRNNDVSKVDPSSFNIRQHRSNPNPTLGLSHEKMVAFPNNQLLAGEYAGYKLYTIKVKKFKSFKELEISTCTSHSQTLSVLELEDSVIINGKLTFKKMVWNYVISGWKYQYYCILCSVNIQGTDIYKNHIKCPTHLSKVTDSLIWFPEEGFCGSIVQPANVLKEATDVECTTCKLEMPPSYISTHIESPVHKHSYRSVATVNNAVIRRGEEQLTITEIDKRNIYVFFEEILHQHKINTLVNFTSCSICNSNNMPDGISNLFTHIWGQKHRKLFHNYLKEKLRKRSNENIRGFFQVFNTSNVTYCAICNITLEGTNSQVMNEHVGSFAHNTFLVLYLKAAPIKPFLEFTTDNESPELDQSCAANNLKLPTTAIDELPENVNKKSRFFDIGTHISINFDVTIEKYSWNIVTERRAAVGESRYWCAPCDDFIRTNKEVHIATAEHQSNLASWAVILENGIHLMRKSQKSNGLFCLICGDHLADSDAKSHIKSTIHASQLSSILSHCEEVKANLNEQYVNHLYSNSLFHSSLTEILKQNKLTILSIKRGDKSKYEAFCRLCVECFEAPTFSDIDKHISKH